MKAGRELDALVAEKVLGQTGMPTIGFSQYSERIEAAWQVVEHFKALKWDITLYWEDRFGNWIAEFWEPPGAAQEGSNAPTLPHAICLAALRALGDMSIPASVG